MIVLILVLVLVGSGGGDPPNKVTELPKKGPVEPPQLVIKEKEPPKKQDPVPPKVPVLHEPADAAEVARLRQEIEGPLASFPDPPDRAQTFRVGRVAPPGPDGFRSLADACAAARQGGATIIEIHDNGPLFEPSVPLVSRRNLVIRAGAGYRPLLIWERAGAAKSLLAIEGGNLTLEGLDVLLKWGDEPTRKPEAPARDSLFEVSGGDFAARDCTFTAAGKLPQGISLVQLASKGGPARCRLSRCYARGDSLTLLTAKGTGVDALMDGCLIVGGEQPLLDITADGGTVFTLRLLRSTLLAGKTLARVQSPAGKDVSPTVKFLAWDALLAHPGGEPDGDLLRLGNGVADTNVTWRAVNSVYAGWGNLLASGPRQIAPNAKDDWRTLWGYRGGDKVLIDPWPRARPLAPEESGPGPYNPMGTAVHFAANSGPGPVGADLSVVPAGPASWLALLSERLITTPLPLPGGEIPEIPAGNDGRYHGGKITLKGTIDLGQFLTLKAQQGGLGPKVVLEVSGVGEQKTSPIQLQGTDLVLAFKHWNSAKPLTLVPNPTTCADREALIEVTGGSLDLIGASILFPNNIQAATPASMLRVQGGQLRLLKCYLAGPLGKAPPGYRELIHIAGSAENNTELATGCAASESVLLSGKTVLHVQGPEAQVRLQHCIVVAPGDALRFDVGPKAGPRLDLQCLLERNTIAVRGSVFHVANVPPTAGNPNLTGGGRSGIAIQAEANVFVDPFSEPQRRSAMLRFEGDVLPRGLVQWRGKGNGYDEKRLQAYAAAAGADAGRQPHETWARLWGKLAEQQAILLDWSAVPLASFGMDRPQLDCLRLPVRAEIGADLKRLGIVRKK
ncbi:MAG TPA: hypothetical protein VEL76_18495 [Gemmataceae bacterium]|nr:hypothetical protein [Gemmataceae bacterium]